MLPHASAGATFHASMSSGKFHGMIWAATPSGRGCRSGKRVLELVGPAGVVEEVRGGQREIDVARLLDRLAAVERLERPPARGRAPGGCGRCGRGTWPARPGAAPTRRRSPRGRRRRRASTSSGPAWATSASGSSVAGRDRREPLARARLDHLAADEEAVALLERDDVARLGRGRVRPVEARLRRPGSSWPSAAPDGARPAPNGPDPVGPWSRTWPQSTVKRSGDS